MKRFALLVGVAALALSACASQPQAAQPSQPWEDGGAGLSYRVASDSGNSPDMPTKYEIRADQDCPLIFTEMFFLDKDGVILTGGGSFLKDSRGAYQELSSGETITADLGVAVDGAARSKVGSVTCHD